MNFQNANISARNCFVRASLSLRTKQNNAFDSYQRRIRTKYGRDCFPSDRYAVSAPNYIGVTRLFSLEVFISIHLISLLPRPLFSHRSSTTRVDWFRKLFSKMFNLLKEKKNKKRAINWYRVGHDGAAFRMSHRDWLTFWKCTSCILGFSLK